MGALDDAIREHLELKRLHGAAEEDLRRQEVEALGPARRQVAPEEAEDTDGADGQEPAEVETAAGAEAAPITDEAALLSDEAAPQAVDEPEPAAVEPHADVDEPKAAFEDAHAELEAPHAEKTALDEPPSEEHELPFADESPAGHSVADVELRDTQESSAVPVGDTPPRGFEALDDDDVLLDEDDEPGGDEPAGDDEADPDLLEDTPDFLQETPEHDRLWFEQKPPRDFDFD